MLIKCEDCGHDVSDKALACPYCACPISPNNCTQNINNALNTPLKRTTRASKKPMRRANKTGSIRKLTGNRRRPYAVYPPVTDYHDNGTAVLPKAIGYYATYNEALESLVLFNRKPYDVENRSKSFKEIYEAFYKDKFEQSKKNLSYQSSQLYKTAFSNSVKLHDRTFNTLRTEDFQKVIDESGLKHASIEQLVLLFKQMSKYALKMDIIDKDYAQYIHNSVDDDTEKGEPFFQEELDTLWKNSADKTIQIILIMIYSGFRISAFESIEVNVEEQYFKGGTKTKSGKGRIVPIHPKVSKFVGADTFDSFKSHAFRIRFKSKLEELGLDKSVSGKVHTPHDTRHTFSWLCDKYNVDDLAKHLLMGHALKGDVETKVYGHRTLEELRSEIEKIV